MRSYSMKEAAAVNALPLEEKTEIWMRNPWLQQHRPFHMIGNIYYVGLDWVGAYLIDTAAGLVLIDCAMQETWYLIVDNIRALGFDPHNIRKLLLTHGHFDHCGAARAVQEMSHCETWLGRDDAFFFTDRRDLIIREEHVPEFRIDCFYEYGSGIDCGDVVFRPVHCPGHTPGTTSLFFDISHEGIMLTCAIHGGLGGAILARKNLEANGLPVDLQQHYVDSIDRIIDTHVDVLLPSHWKHAVNHDIFQIADADDGSGRGFIDPEAWKRMLSAKRQIVLDMMARGE